MGKNRICFVIPNYITRIVGGAELQVYIIAKELQSRGWEIEVISSYTKDKKIIHSQYINPLIKHYYYRRSKIIFTEFFKVLVQLNKTKSYYYFQRTDYPLTGATALFCKLTGRKMIYWIADDDCVKKNRYSVSFRPEEYNSTLKLLIRKLDIYIVDKMIVFGKKNAHYVISQTKTQQEKMLENFKIKSTLIRNSYSFNQDRFPKKENIILWVGNFRNSKQPELFVEIAKNPLFANWRFVMVGDSSSYFQEVANVSLPNFEYKGQVPLEESSEWFAKAKIYINTSILEGFPNAFIQSWYYQTFILSLVVDPDLILAKDMLGICANGDLSQLTDQLAYFCSNEENMQPYLKRGYEFVIKEFDIKKNTDKLIHNLADKKLRD